MLVPWSGHAIDGATYENWWYWVLTFSWLNSTTTHPQKTYPGYIAMKVGRHCLEHMLQTGQRNQNRFEPTRNCQYLSSVDPRFHGVEALSSMDDLWLPVLMRKLNID